MKKLFILFSAFMLILSIPLADISALEDLEFKFSLKYSEMFGAEYDVGTAMAKLEHAQAVLERIKHKWALIESKAALGIKDNWHEKAFQKGNYTVGIHLSEGKYTFSAVETTAFPVSENGKTVATVVVYAHANPKYFTFRNGQELMLLEEITFIKVEEPQE